MHALPVEPFEQGCELRRREAYDAILDLRPAELTDLRTLGGDDQAAAFLDALGNETAFANRANSITGNSASAPMR